MTLNVKEEEGVTGSQEQRPTQPARYQVIDQAEKRQRWEEEQGIEGINLHQVMIIKVRSLFLV